MDQKQPTFEQWCIVELYGHNKIAGLVSEQTIGGSTFVRVDVPEVKRNAVTLAGSRPENVVETIAPFTKFYGANAIYAITPVSEEIARAIAVNLTAKPVHSFELPQLKALESGHEIDEDFDDEEGD